MTAKKSSISKTTTAAKKIPTKFSKEPPKTFKPSLTEKSKTAAPAVKKSLRNSLPPMTPTEMGAQAVKSAKVPKAPLEKKETIHDLVLELLVKKSMTDKEISEAIAKKFPKWNGKRNLKADRAEINEKTPALKIIRLTRNDAGNIVPYVAGEKTAKKSDAADVLRAAGVITGAKKRVAGLSI